MKLKSEDWMRIYAVMCGCLMAICVVLTLDNVEKNTAFQFEMQDKLNKCEASYIKIHKMFNTESTVYDTVERQKGWHYKKVGR